MSQARARGSYTNKVPNMEPRRKARRPKKGPSNQERARRLSARPTTDNRASRAFERPASIFVRPAHHPRYRAIASHHAARVRFFVPRELHDRAETSRSHRVGLRRGQFTGHHEYGMHGKPDCTGHCLSRHRHHTVCTVRRRAQLASARAVLVPIHHPQTCHYEWGDACIPAPLLRNVTMRAELRRRHTPRGVVSVITDVPFMELPVTCHQRGVCIPMSYNRRTCTRVCKIISNDPPLA